jgi:hypothetical protein
LLPIPHKTIVHPTHPSKKDRHEDSLK